MKSKGQVIIIGAGLAGLCCALRLQQEGMAFTVFEASDSAGGRIKTDILDGFLLDRGFQIFLTAYPESAKVLDYKALDLHSFSPGALVRQGGQFHQLSDPARRPARAIETLMSPVGSISDKVKVGLLRQGILSSSRIPHQEGAKPLSTIEALKAMGFSESMISQFFQPFLGGIFLETDLKTQACMFDFVFKMLAAGDNVLPAKGMQAIPRQIADALPAERIKFNTQVVGIEGNAVLLSSGERVEGSAIVIAVEEPQARKLLGLPELKSFRSQTCLYFSADKPPLDEPILVLNGENSGPVNNFCVPSNVSSSYAPSGKALLSASVIGDPELSDEVLLKSVLKQLKDWFGDQVDAWKHLRTYRVKYSLPDQSPEMAAEVNRSYRADSPLYTCGDYKENASINGAMLSGRKAAEAIIADLAEKPLAVSV